MLRTFILAAVVSLAPGVCGEASAQPRRGFVYGRSDHLVQVAELEAKPRELARQAMGVDCSVGYYYRYYFFLHEKLNFWSFGGQHVLYHDDRYLEMTPGQWIDLIGEEKYNALGRPWAYTFPPALLGLLAIVAAIGFAASRSALSRAKRLLKDGRFQQGVQIYTDALPADREPTRDDRRAALASAVEFMHETHRVPPARGERGLRTLVDQLERAYSYALRNDAVAHEEAGEWEQAAELYRQAAGFREEWDAKDYEFLLGCVERVRRKQARDPSPPRAADDAVGE